MLKVKVKVKKSDVHGTGLFAGQLIPKGTVTWEYNPNFDKSFTQEELDRLPRVSREFCLYYSYFDKVRGLYILPTDHLRFINHSEDINKINIESTPDKDVSLRDILPGEELLCDYRKFDSEYFERIGLSVKELV